MLEVADIKSNFGDACILEVYSSCMYMPTPQKLRERATQYMQDDRISIFGCKDDDMIVGVIALRWDSDHVYELVGIAVAPAFRNRNIGRTLITDATNVLPIETLYAETDDESVGFYRNCGFEIEDLGFKYEHIRRYRCTYTQSHTHKQL